MAKRILKFLNTLVDLAVFLALLISGSYSAFALWDNNRVYAQAENVREELLAFKPKTDPLADNGASFEELRAINPDVCAWLSLADTKIDYPVLQGDSNLSYINTDVYGNFALAGSIFLDSRCNTAFRDSFSLLYGHHMDSSKMFGDLDLYKDEPFFSENPGGLLILPDRTYKLEILACLLVPSSERYVFEPQQWRDGAGGLVDFAERNAILLSEPLLERIRSCEECPPILGMSTCASEFTDARTVVLAVMEEINGGS